MILLKYLYCSFNIIHLWYNDFKHLKITSCKWKKNGGMKKVLFTEFNKLQSSLCRSQIWIHGKCISKVKRDVGMKRTKSESQKVCASEKWLNWKQKKTLLPKQKVSVSVAASKEQPGLTKYGLGVLLPLLLSESQTTDVSGQSVQTQAQRRRASPSPQQKVTEMTWCY